MKSATAQVAPLSSSELAAVAAGAAASRGTLDPIAVAQVPDALLKVKTACSLADISTPTFYRKAATDPTFPKLVRLSQRCTRVRAGDWLKWLATQAGAAHAATEEATQAGAAPAATTGAAQ